MIAKAWSFVDFWRTFSTSLPVWTDLTTLNMLSITPCQLKSVVPSQMLRLPYERSRKTMGSFFTIYISTKILHCGSLTNINHMYFHLVYVEILITCCVQGLCCWNKAVWVRKWPYGNSDSSESVFPTSSIWDYACERVVYNSINKSCIWTLKNVKL